MSNITTNMSMDHSAVENTKEKRDDSQQLLNDFAQSTTMHGLHNISACRSKPGKILWLILLSLSIFYMIKSSIISVKRYYQYPFTTEIGEEFAGVNGLEFPAITVCPMNMFVKKKIEYQDENRFFREYGLNLEICKATREARRKFNLTCGQFMMCTLNLYRMGLSDCGRETKSILANYLRTNTNASATAYEEEFRDKYGPSLEGSLVLCKFGNDKCKAREFTQTVSQYGKCYQFNGDTANASLTYVTGSLFLVLDAKVDEYTQSPFFTEGFRIHIQQQGTFTAPKTGFVVSPGNIASVGVRQKRKMFLKSPYKSNCTDKSLLGFSTYSMMGCALECFENLRIAKCGCRSCGYLKYQADHIRVCGTNDSFCEHRLKKFEFNPKMCHCPPPCSEITYDYKLSYSVFPDKSSSKLMKKYRRIDIEYQRNNYVAVDIQYDATSYSMQSEKETYTWEALLGEFGGNLGLMVGCSVLTGAEFVQLFIMLIYSGIQKLMVKLRCKKAVGWTDQM